MPDQEQRTRLRRQSDKVVSSDAQRITALEEHLDDQDRVMAERSRAVDGKLGAVDSKVEAVDAKVMALAQDMDGMRAFAHILQPLVDKLTEIVEYLPMLQKDAKDRAEASRLAILAAEETAEQMAFIKQFLWLIVGGIITLTVTVIGGALYVQRTISLLELIGLLVAFLGLALLILWRIISKQQRLAQFLKASRTGQAPP